jgi:hypothetical protein
MVDKRPLKNVGGSQSREIKSGQKGEPRGSIDIFKITTQGAGVQTTYENVAGKVERTGGGKNALRDLGKRQHLTVPEASVGGPLDRSSEAHDIAGESVDKRLNRTFKNFTALHGYGFKIIEEDVARRVRENPRPTSIEMTMGIYREELRPQFRDAIPLMVSKGYETWSSGSRLSSGDFQWDKFGGEPQAVPEGMQEQVLKDFPDVVLGEGDKEHFRTQQVDGMFTLDEVTISKLKNAGFNVETRPREDKMYTRIFFGPREANLKKIKDDCDRLARILPETGKTVSPNMSQSAIEFRARYSGDTNVASSSAAAGAISIPGRRARDADVSSREASPHSSSEESSGSSPRMEL